MFDPNLIHYVTTEEKLSIALDAIASTNVVSIDVETTGLNPRRKQLRLIQVAIPDGRVFVIDVFRINKSSLLPLAKIIADPFVVKIAHHAKFEVSWLETQLLSLLRTPGSVDLYPESFCCTYLGAQLLACGTPRGNGLKDIAPMYLGPQASLDKTLQTSDWGEWDLSGEQIEYAARDAMVLIPLREEMTKRLKNLDMLRVAKIEFDAVIPIAMSEMDGIHLDRDQWSSLLVRKTAVAQDKEQRLRELLQPGCNWLMKNPDREKQPKAPERGFKKPVKKNFPPGPFFDLAMVQYSQQIEYFLERRKRYEAEKSDWKSRAQVPGIINLNSPDQVQKAFANLGLDLEETNDTYIQKILPRLQGSQLILIQALTEFRESAKSVSAFGQSFLDAIEWEDGRIHPDFKQIGAQTTGRMSCSGSGVEGVKINLQQVPKDNDHRGCFTASDGNDLVIADYGQMELRLLAQFSGDKVLCDAFQRGLDPFKVSATQVYGIPYDKVDRKLRNQMKTLMYGLSYGIGAGKFGFSAGIPFEEARRVLNTWYARHDGATRWLNAAAQQVQDYGFARTPYGRLLRFDFDKNDKGATAAAGRNGKNAPMQGGNADITKLALSLLWDRIKGTGIKIVNIVHDEIVLESDKDDSEYAKFMLEDSMREASSQVLTTVPVSVDAHIASNWVKQ